MQQRNSDNDHPNDESVEGKSADPLLDMLSPIAAKKPGELPKSIKRYRIHRLLGEGSFGQVFLGHDDQLQRDVAIKVPTGKFLSDPSRTADYLNEARTIAGLDHPNIIPVYDVGSTFDYPIYIVTKYIKGQSLAERIRQNGPSLEQAIVFVSSIANALHFAHRKGVIHRDVKPENILIDEDQKPYLVDLGLALSEKTGSLEGGIIGTPAYMSPEQARGEGHRVDGRTDIYSLGVVLYELLLGRRPFSANSTKELMDRISNTEPKPPRQVNDAIPKQLERICLKAIARMAKERYTTARDFAEDLQDYLAESSELHNADANLHDAGYDSRVKGSSVNRTRREQSTAEPIPQTTSEVIPKGPQSFDSHDADFFLALLPGPYDRNGIPESIRFWKKGIENVNNPFHVGLIYGPSGSGKSSFLQAGLLPRLAEDINVCFVQTTSDATETAILSSLKKTFPKLPKQLKLQDAIKTLRRADHHSHGRKTLIVLDQFEQWLANRIGQPEIHRAELVQALRQCDGENVQCLITIRDDFWMAITDFFSQIEVELINGLNTSSIERFDVQHAKAVLHRFGAAFGKLPTNRADLTVSQESFLNKAVAEFAVNGRVACVAIALLAEMLKHSNWSADTIQRIGGMRGLGMAYLEQYFNGPQAPPQNRIHEPAVRNVLQALLPLDDTSIKGRAISGQELSAIAGYENNPEKQKQLLQVLESRLITSVEESDVIGPNREIKYQLAHDFFVPAIRDWITTSQQRTPQGRAELLLDQRARNWKAKPENQRLPGMAEFLQLVRHTRNSPKSTDAKVLLASAWKYYLTRLVFLAIAVGLLGSLAGWGYLDLKSKQAESEATTLIASLFAAPADAVPYVLKNLEQNARSQTMLRKSFESTANEKEKFRSAIALANAGQTETEYLLELLPNSNRGDAQLIVDVILAQQPPEATSIIANQLENISDLAVIARLEILRSDLRSPHHLQELLAIKPDSTLRSQIIANYEYWDHDWRSIRNLISKTTERGLLTGLLQAMALVNPERVEPTTRGKIAAATTRLYVESPDALVHASCKSLLKNWGEDIPSLVGKPIPMNSQWQETRNGMTMVKIPRGSFLREILDRGKFPRTIKHDFWISDTEVPSRLFREYANDPNLDELDKPMDSIDFRTRFRKTQRNGRRVETPFSIEHPIQLIYASDAIQFCNWLSRREGLTPVYRKGRVLRKLTLYENEGERVVHEWKIQPDADGYRLPGAYEFEYARNGNSNQLFPFGDDHLLAKYFCVLSPSGSNLKLAGCELSASRLPNPFGLFDMCGNLGEMSHAVQLGDNEILLNVNRVVYSSNSWETNEFNYSTSRLLAHMSMPARIQGGFRVVRNRE